MDPLFDMLESWKDIFSRLYSSMKQLVLVVFPACFYNAVFQHAKSN